MRTICADKYNIHIGHDSLAELDTFLSKSYYSSFIILVDENTKKKCLPIVRKSFSTAHSLYIIQIKSGEKNKNIRNCEKIWRELSGQNADRESLIINLGGGVITDIGGFAASTYKRGIDFINIPTTLLAQADTSVGGKTGIDFMNFKNQIGTFAFPKAVFIHPLFLETLDKKELLSGFAEVIKHGLIADKNYWEQIQASVGRDLKSRPAESWNKLISESVEIKIKIVVADPYENGLRKALNFGHTIGHAIESASLKSKKKMLHGEAIALGMICEAYLSRKCCGLSSQELDSITEFIVSIFKPPPLKSQAKQLIGLMQQDKKNKDSEINFTLLSAIGKAEINNSCSEELIEESIHFLNAICNQ
ncbi:MAG: 3-dehydroquinate synthase [Bacteroidetes bacterium]|nr:MAG: 3-dehydroquinate synthase [Bacteroidota bacterium]